MEASIRCWNFASSPIYWCITKKIKLLAAPCLFSRKSPTQSARVSGKGNAYFSQDGGQIKIQKNIDHHNSRPVASICHQPDTSYFSLITIFKFHFFSLFCVQCLGGGRCGEQVLFIFFLVIYSRALIINFHDLDP